MGPGLSPTAQQELYKNKKQQQQGPISDSAEEFHHLRPTEGILEAGKAVRES